MGWSGGEQAVQRQTLSVCGYRPFRVAQGARVGLASLGDFPYASDPWSCSAPPTWLHGQAPCLVTGQPLVPFSLALQADGVSTEDSATTPRELQTPSLKPFSNPGAPSHSPVHHSPRRPRSTKTPHVSPCTLPSAGWKVDGTGVWAW